MKTSARLVLVVVGTAFYLGLAVLGWGGPAGFFSHPALVVLALALLVLAGVSVAAGVNLSAGVREGPINAAAIRSRLSIVSSAP